MQSHQLYSNDYRVEGGGVACAEATEIETHPKGLISPAGFQWLDMWQQVRPLVFSFG